MYKYNPDSPATGSDHSAQEEVKMASRFALAEVSHAHRKHAGSSQEVMSPVCMTHHFRQASGVAPNSYPNPKHKPMVDPSPNPMVHIVNMSPVSHK